MSIKGLGCSFARAPIDGVENSSDVLGGRSSAMNESDPQLCVSCRAWKTIVVQHNLSAKLNGIPSGLTGKEQSRRKGREINDYWWDFRA